MSILIINFMQLSPCPVKTSHLARTMELNTTEVLKDLDIQRIELIGIRWISMPWELFSLSFAGVLKIVKEKRYGNEVLFRKTLSAVAYYRTLRACRMHVVLKLESSAHTQA